MKMVGNQRPSITPRPAIRNDFFQATQEIISILFVPEDFSALDTTPNNVVQRPRCIYSGLSWHDQLLKWLAARVNMKI
jgi:hypothetical protein